MTSFHNFLPLAVVFSQSVYLPVQSASTAAPPEGICAKSEPEVCILLSTTAYSAYCQLPSIAENLCPRTCKLCEDPCDKPEIYICTWANNSSFSFLCNENQTVCPKTCGYCDEPATTCNLVCSQDESLDPQQCLCLPSTVNCSTTEPSFCPLLKQNPDYSSLCDIPIIANVFCPASCGSCGSLDRKVK